MRQRDEFGGFGFGFHTLDFQRHARAEQAECGFDAFLVAHRSRVHHAQVTAYLAFGTKQRYAVITFDVVPRQQRFIGENGANRFLEKDGFAVAHHQFARRVMDRVLEVGLQGAALIKRQSLQTRVLRIAPTCHDGDFRIERLRQALH